MRGSVTLSAFPCEDRPEVDGALKFTRKLQLVKHGWCRRECVETAPTRPSKTGGRHAPFTRKWRRRRRAEAPLELFSSLAVEVHSRR